jgi:hypothetical protein
MMADTSDQFYDIDKNSIGHTCCLCECPNPHTHVSYWKCPIFENNPICAECCLIDALKPGIEKKFSEKLGREITREEIIKTCQGCGMNHAVEDKDIADQLEANSFESSAPKEENPPKPTP